LGNAQGTQGTWTSPVGAAVFLGWVELVLAWLVLLLFLYCNRLKLSKLMKYSWTSLTKTKWKGGVTDAGAISFRTNQQAFSVQAANHERLHRVIGCFHHDMHILTGSNGQGTA